mgnify:CR=1 FL=1
MKNLIILAVLLISTNLYSQSDFEYGKKGVVEITGRWDPEKGEYKEYDPSTSTTVSYLIKTIGRTQRDFMRIIVRTSSGDETNDSEIVNIISETEDANYITYLGYSNLAGAYKLIYNGDKFLLYFNSRIEGDNIRYYSYYEGYLIKSK